MKAKKYENIYLSEGNKELRTTEQGAFLIWSLPAVKSCPYATDFCKMICYARKAENIYKNVLPRRTKNYEETFKETFVTDMIGALEYQLSRRKYKDTTVYVRIHESGDFYSAAYLKKWIEISDHFKTNNKIIFQAYTKSLPILREVLKEVKLEDINIKLVWSIMQDSKEEETLYAQSIGLGSFKAIEKTEVDVCRDNGNFICGADCGECKECYTGTSTVVKIRH